MKKWNQVQGGTCIRTISTSRQVEHAFVTRGTKDRYAGGALRNEEMGQTIQLSVGGQRKRNGRMYPMHQSRIVFQEADSIDLKRNLERCTSVINDVGFRFRMSLKCVQSKDLLSFSTENLMHVWNYDNKMVMTKRIDEGMEFCNFLL